MRSSQVDGGAGTAPSTPVAEPAAHCRQDPEGRIEWHALVDHLEGVAQLAAEKAASWHSAEWGMLAGQWHDLGKYRPGFQSYIRQSADPNAHIEGRVAGPQKTHSAAGALHTLRLFEEQWGPAGKLAARPLSYVIAGHHAGLSDWHAGEHQGLHQRLASEDSRIEHDEAVSGCRESAAHLLKPPPGFDPRAALVQIPGIRSERPLAASLWVRMLFSALVDADFLDTERFMDEDRAATRGQPLQPAQYLACLDAYLAGKAEAVAASGRAGERVMRARAEVLRSCRQKAPLPPGVFSLTVPTGGGKTLSSLAFAMQHAATHEMSRVVYAIPYTSIIEQTADVFRSVFADLGSEAVIEHHSQAEGGDQRETARTRLACENWDAGLIVTTNVQLFESLFAARTSRCRKLHNLARSVIVLDEAQLLPPEYLQPILDALHVLVKDYGVTLLLCTATQPALTTRSEFDARRSLRGLPPPTEIVDDPASLFSALKRVRVHWPADLTAPQEWPTVVTDLAERDCALAIVNTRKDAYELTEQLLAHDPGTLHLSAAMCGAHRKDVIQQIRAQLDARRRGAQERLHVVSTQLIEAGVDIDFPVVYRAMAGLDSIAQASGRCNREGQLDAGEVVVFVRAIPHPMAQVKFGAQATRSVVARLMSSTPNTDPFTPDAFTQYFRHYYQQFPSLDKHGIVDLLSQEAQLLQFAFRTAADAFRLVSDEDQATLVVPYHCIDPAHGSLEPLLKRLAAGDTDRWLLRALQRYTVTARLKLVREWQKSGDAIETAPGLYLLSNELLYDRRYGLLPQGKPLDAASLIQ